MENHCHVDAVEKIPTETEKKETIVQMLVVRGMGCHNCAARVRNSLISVTGVVAAYINHQTGVAYVEVNPSLATTEDLIQAVSRAGGDSRHEYKAQLIRYDNNAVI